MYQINYCDYNACNRDCDMIYRPGGSGDYLFLLLMTPMKFYLEKEMTITRPMACILYSPGVPQHYQSVRKFKNSYIHFSAPQGFLKEYDLVTNIVCYPQHADELNHIIRKIHTEYLSKDLYYQEKMNAYMDELFITLARCLRTDHGLPDTAPLLYQDFQRARLRILSSCEQQWDAAAMAALVNLSKSQFYHYYTLFFHTTPKAELINARIDKAKYLLSNEALQIQQVSQLSGFQNLSHFTRCFKKLCGCSPSRWGK